MLFRSPDQRSPFERLADHGLQLFEVAGLGQEIVSSVLQRADGPFDGRMTREHDDLHRRRRGADSAADGVLRFGGLLPETGNLALLGPPEFAGVELAVAEINMLAQQYGLPGVEYLPGDSGDNGDVANATVDRLLAENVDAFIGAASSGVSLTVIDKITQAGKIQFSPANTSPVFTTYDDNGLYFRTAPSDVVQGAALADVMINDGAATAAFLVLNDSYDTGLLKYTKEPYEIGRAHV